MKISCKINLDEDNAEAYIHILLRSSDGEFDAEIYTSMDDLEIFPRLVQRWASGSSKSDLDAGFGNLSENYAAGAVRFQAEKIGHGLCALRIKIISSADKNNGSAFTAISPISVSIMDILEISQGIENARLKKIMYFEIEFQARD